MSEDILDKLKNNFFGLEESNDHEAPEHLVPEGPELGWSAADLSDDELVDDEWIAANTKEAK